MNKVLLIMVFLPAAAAVVVALIGSKRATLVRCVTLAATLVTLLLAFGVVTLFNTTQQGVNVEIIPGTDPRTIPPTAFTYGPFHPQLETKADWLGLGDGSDPRTPKVQFYLGIDGISLWLVVLTALLMVPSVLVSWESITDRPASFYALLLLLETGLLGVFCSFDLFLFYIFFEFTLVPLFFLIGIWGGPQKRYAARKFFIYTLAGSVISLVGIVAFALAMQEKIGRLTFSIPELAAAVERLAATGEMLPADVQGWIFIALFIGFAVKVPLFPFHTWLPIAHVEAPTAGSVILAGVLLKLGTYGFLRLCLPMLPDATVSVGVPLVATLATIGIIYGALCSLAQNDLKKLVAYSSISHLGFCMLGMFALNVEGISGSVLYMVNHGLSTGALFLLVGMVYDRYHTREMGEMSGLTARLPVLAFFMVFISLSSVALPGLNGFVGELLTLIGMFKAHPAYAVVGAVGIILGAWYLLGMLQRSFFGPLREPHHEGRVTDLDAREVWALAPIAAVCLLIGVYPQPFIKYMEPEVKAIAAIYERQAAAKIILLNGDSMKVRDPEP